MSPQPGPNLPFDETVALRNRHIGKSCSLFYRDAPLKIVRAEQQYMYDDKGNRYLDCVNNVAHVGHCHPRVVRAECEQAAILNTNSRFLHDNLVLYAQKLCSLFPASLSVCYFVNSGSEANDLALQLARHHTGGRHVIAVDHAYHGHLTSILPISPYKYRQRKSFVVPDWSHIAPVPDVYRGMYRRPDCAAGGDSTATLDNIDDGDLGVLYAGEVKKIVDKIQSSGEQVAAFIAESMLSCAGQILLPANYLRRVYECVREAGGVCIADEVQVGFGRVGSKWWAFQLQGDDVVPDIVTLGKPMGNGHPVSAVVTTAQIADSFHKVGGGFFNTFGGNPVSCAVALAVIDVIESERLMVNAKDVGDYLLKLALKLRDIHPIVGDVRGAGLFVGIELVKDRQSREPATAEATIVCNRLKDNFIIVSVDGPYENVLKLKPPMVYTKENAKFVFDVLNSVLSTLV